MIRATLLSHRKAPGPVATLLLGGLLTLDLAVVPSAGAQETSGLTPPVPQSSTEVAYPGRVGKGPVRPWSRIRTSRHVVRASDAVHPCPGSRRPIYSRRVSPHRRQVYTLR